VNEKLFRRVIPVYGNDVDQFKYGSIGNDDENGLPYLIWRVLPDVFPDHLPGYPDHVAGGTGYAALGFVWEEGRDHADTPVGFSRARIGFDRDVDQLRVLSFIGRTNHAGRPTGHRSGRPFKYQSTFSAISVS